MPWTRNRTSSIFSGLLLEDADELLADDLALALGLVDSRQLLEEAVVGIDMDERDPEPPKGLDNLHGLVVAHQAVIDEDAREPLADRAVDEHRGDGRIDTAGEATDDARLPDLLADRLDLLVDDRRRRPALLAAGDIAQEAGEDLRAVRRVDDLGVKLDAVEAALGRLAGGDRRAGARGERSEALRRLEDRVPVAHPAALIGGRAAEEAPAVLAGRGRCGRTPPRGPAQPCRPADWTIACIP